MTTDKTPRILSALIVALSLATVAAELPDAFSTSGTISFVPSSGKHLDPQLIDPGVIGSAILVFILVVGVIAIYEALAAGIDTLLRKSRGRVRT